MKVYIKDKHFGDKVIFKDFSLSLEDGTTAVVMGESGRGKTTLMRIIAELDKDYDGFVEKEGKVALLFQEDRLVENISVLSNLLLVTDDRERALLLLKKMGLENEEKSNISSLSGGMRRRVSIARLLLLDFDTYIFDEPFSSLDEETKKRVSKIIREETKGKTIIVVTHNKEDIVLFERGREINL